MNHLDEIIKEVLFTRIGKKTTIALVTLENGFEVVGTSACVNPEDFDQEIGEKFALKNAIDKIEELEGYLSQAKGYGA